MNDVSTFVPLVLLTLPCLTLEIRCTALYIGAKSLI
jgi:hypothetical protein